MLLMHFLSHECYILIDPCTCDENVASTFKQPRCNIKTTRLMDKYPSRVFLQCMSRAFLIYLWHSFMSVTCRYHISHSRVIVRNRLQSTAASIPQLIFKFIFPTVSLGNRNDQIRVHNNRCVRCHFIH